ncbi:MAG: hypothetical protein KKF62_02795 [Bacteroidetes bacterium]|nr:hypothetical protein [Bacteroidota bacterium]MBU1113725.1 hypothetical protein [Bacteroidota bacterium]MBU1799375.1 hypothetical protein [Bacteroidota bacterium]
MNHGNPLNRVSAKKSIYNFAIFYFYSMPPKLVKAHQELDKAVDLCYRSQTFITENTRIEFLFNLYNQYTAPLIKSENKSRKKK